MFLLILSIIGIIIGALGILLVIIFYKKAKKEKKLTYLYKSSEIISKRKTMPEDLEINYKGKKVKKLSKTIIIIWNNGKETIKSEDILKEHPIDIVFQQNVTVFPPNILKVCREKYIKFEAEKILKNKIRINFNCLEYKDGATIEIIHTGDQNSEINIEGAIMGAPKGIENKGKLLLFTDPTEIYSRKRRNTILILLCAVFLAINYSYKEFSKFFNFNFQNIYIKIFEYIFGCTIILYFTYDLIKDFLFFPKKYPKKLDPKI